MYDEPRSKPKMDAGLKAVIWIVGSLVALFVLLIISPFTIVSPQEAAVVTRVGSINRELSNGLSWKIPLFETVNKVDISVSNIALDEVVYSKDAQTVQMQANVGYKVDAAQVGAIFRDTRFQHESKWITPAIKDAIRAVAARYTAQGLLDNRSSIPLEVKDQFIIALKERGAFGIIVDGISLTNIDLDDKYEAAVLAKQVAEQQALEQVNVTKQEKEKKEQQILKAEALSEKTRLEAVALQSAQGQKVIEKIYAEAALEAAKKWNGQMPVNMYGSAPLPFINVAGN